MKKELTKLPYPSMRVDRYPITDTQTLEWVADTDDYFNISGVGYLPLEGFVYDEEYFEKYVQYEGSFISRALNTMRKQLVIDTLRNAYGVSFDPKRDIVDVGVGSGTFVEGMGCRGTDVNPAGIEMLKRNGDWADPTEPVAVKTYWDSLEHIENLTEELSTAKEFAFVSCPVYLNIGHVLNSKHLRPDEHCWYWTRQGFIDLMETQGFVVTDCQRFETLIGREDIETFVCRRVDGR